MFANVYQNRSVLVTGHTGFVGSWLTLWLTELGAKVAGYSVNVPTQPSLFECLGMRSRLTHHVVGDVGDLSSLQRAFAKSKPEMVFHLAAQPLVRLSYAEPVSTFNTNVMGTVHVLECLRQSDFVRAALMVTSDKCYDNQEWPHGYRESDPMGGYDPYSSSKGCAELVVQAYNRSYFSGDAKGPAVASVRAGNIIGGGDWSLDRLIPDAVRAVAERRKLTIRSPFAIRPWQHVMEPLSGYLLLGAKLYREGHPYAGAWNLGPHDELPLTVEQLVSAFYERWGQGDYSVESADLHEAHWLSLDIGKAVQCLHWTPVWKAPQAISDTARWYQAYYAQTQDLMATSLGTLECYTADACTKGLVWTKDQC